MFARFCFEAGRFDNAVRSPAPGAYRPLGNAELRFGAWEGPLDLLLELARAQKVDLARLSNLAQEEAFGPLLLLPAGASVG
jgi:hypothetical protein